MAAEDYTYMGHTLCDDVTSFGNVPCTPAHLTALQRKKDQEKILNELFGGQEGLEELKRLING